MIPFVDLARQQERIGEALNDAISRVLAHGQYIMGPEVGEFESRLAEYCDVKHCVTCANGTDALLLAIKALELAPGSMVVVPAMTFVATAEAVTNAGMVPFFCDVNAETHIMEPDDLEAAFAAAARQDLKVSAVIPVDLFGLPADYTALVSLADEHGASVIADAAQSMGGGRAGRQVGALAPLTTTSFFPAKPLGCYGDGGAVLTEDEELASRIASMRMHGKGIDKYHSQCVGMNSRLDTLQAAILIEKLKILDEERAERERVAEFYHDGLGSHLGIQTSGVDVKHAWAQFTIRAPNRDSIRARLADAGIPTQVYYPQPLHAQEAYKHFPRVDELPVSERLSAESMSLPFHPYLEKDTQRQIIDVTLGRRDRISA